MEELRIQRVTKALGLNRQIVGIRFLVYKKEYDENPGSEMADTTLCKMVSQAGNGLRTKTSAKGLHCLAGAYASGMSEIPEEVSSARAEYSRCMYESFAIARQVFTSKKYIPQKIYGIEISPLEMMGEADLALIIGTAKDMMRVMQGYARYYGVAKNILTTGTSGVCSDLISKPAVNNDINVSLLSSGSRKNGSFSAKEMGIAMPIHYIADTMAGILETVNLTENNKPKEEILKRLNYPEELGFSIRMNYDYAIQGMEYQKHCEECLAEENRKQTGR